MEGANTLLEWQLSAHHWWLVLGIEESVKGGGGFNKSIWFSMPRSLLPSWWNLRNALLPDTNIYGITLQSAPDTKQRDEERGLKRAHRILMITGK